jgi:ABC-2 type transport system permease protein
MFALLFSLGLTLHLQISPELMQQAQHEFAGTAQMYIKELWNLPIATILICFHLFY